MSKIVNSLVVKIISKEMMEQYEKIRQTGLTNMYDYYGVVRFANVFGFAKLARISLEDYKTLLFNFQKLMKHYNIKQPVINTGNESYKPSKEGVNVNTY